MITDAETEAWRDFLACSGPSLPRLLGCSGPAGSPPGQQGRDPQGQESALCCLNSGGSSGSPTGPISLGSHIPDILPRRGRGQPEGGNPEPLDRGWQGERSPGDQACWRSGSLSTAGAPHRPDLRPPKAPLGVLGELLMRKKSSSTAVF